MLSQLTLTDWASAFPSFPELTALAIIGAAFVLICELERARQRRE